jgi:hypothetical protein
MVIPALWRRTVNGAKALMAEGQSSLLPHDSDWQSCFGRLWFAKYLSASAESRTRGELRAHLANISITAQNRGNTVTRRQRIQEMNDELYDLVWRKCTEWDLEGL